jgi:2'-5' RNA ligase
MDEPSSPFPGTHFSATPAHTLPADTRDFAEWRRGRVHYAVWVIDVHDAAVCARMRAAQHHLGLSRLHTLPGRAAHVTVFVCGFEVAERQLDDDFEGAMARAQETSLARLQCPPFELVVGGLDSFDSAAFLRVADPSGSLERLRHALAATCPEQRFAPYVPHLTLGLYQRAEPKEELARCLAAFADAGPLALPVQRLRRVRYDARVLDAALETTCVLPLRGPEHRL